jgi:hypothetical protein
MHHCVALCLFGIGPERLRTAYIRIGVKADANSKSSRCSFRVEVLLASRRMTLAADAVEAV